MDKDQEFYEESLRKVFEADVLIKLYSLQRAKAYVWASVVICLVCIFFDARILLEYNLILSPFLGFIMYFTSEISSLRSSSEFERKYIDSYKA